MQVANVATTTLQLHNTQHSMLLDAQSSINSRLPDKNNEKGKHTNKMCSIFSLISYKILCV